MHADDQQFVQLFVLLHPSSDMQIPNPASGTGWKLTLFTLLTPANSWNKFRRFLGKAQHQKTLGVALDRRAAAERALDLSQRQFRILVESVTDYAIYLLDAKGHVVSWNTGAQRIKGYSADEILGQHFSRFYPENDRRNGLPQRALEAAVRERKWEGEGWRVRKDGSQFWANAVIHRSGTRMETWSVLPKSRVTSPNSANSKRRSKRRMLPSSRRKNGSSRSANRRHRPRL